MNIRDVTQRTADTTHSRLHTAEGAALFCPTGFVHEGARLPSVWSQLQGQIYLGPPAFIEKMQALVDKKPLLTEIPRAQRRAAKRVLAEFAGAHERNEAIALAYLSGRHTMSAIAAYFGVHYTTVSRLVKAYEADQKV